jgi:hypothetical protein
MENAQEASYGWWTWQEASESPRQKCRVNDLRKPKILTDLFLHLVMLYPLLQLKARTSLSGYKDTD